MKVAIDRLPLESGHKVRGMGFYTKHLIESLEQLAKNDNNFYLESFNFNENKDKLASFDVIHYPYFDLFFHTLPLKKATKTVVTIPDVIPLIYPDKYPPGLRGKIKFYLQKLSLNSTAHIVTISETSKKDIVRFLGVNNKKITVTHLAPQFKKIKKLSKAELAKIKKKLNLPAKYVLYVGDVNYNKNLPNLAKAIKLANKKLVIVGKQAAGGAYDERHIENVSLHTFLSEYENDKDIVRLGYLEKQEYEAVWQMAEIYCQPSFYEGFGLPITEAFAAKVPVAASKIQVFKEIAADAVEYFNPKSPKSIANSLTKISKNKTIQKNLAKKGEKKLKDYSWEKTAEKTLDVYKKVHETK